jgi:hypothetical protein
MVQREGPAPDRWNGSSGKFTVKAVRDFEHFLPTEQPTRPTLKELPSPGMWIQRETRATEDQQVLVVRNYGQFDEPEEYEIAKC